MKKYIKPELEINELDVEDVITASWYSKDVDIDGKSTNFLESWFQN